MKTTEIHRRFVEYYEGMGYCCLPRAPMLDPSIPMSFVMSAGLVQVETSLAKAHERHGDKFVLVQSCFRHFDLHKVGTDDIHLSFFEMPGAFVFGENNRADTINRMWTLATQVLGIDKDKIWATYFSGGQVLNNSVPADKSACLAWNKTDIPKSHIVGLGVEHNYWIQGKGISSSGTNRKSGPNTELFYDRGDDRCCGVDCRPGCSCGRFIQFSNSLFICSEIDESNNWLKSIRNPFSETVIGAERIAIIQQRTPSVFETDPLKPIIETIRPFVQSPLSKETTIYEHIIADHMRGLYFLVADGAPPPGKDGRQRIVKILIRRVISYQFVLGLTSKDVISEIIDCIESRFSIEQRNPNTKENLLQFYLLEKNWFQRTIERGYCQINRLIKQNRTNQLTAKQIGELEEYWGIPEILSMKLVKANPHIMDIPGAFVFSTGGD